MQAWRNHHSIKLGAENTIRWRWNKDMDGPANTVSFLLIPLSPFLHVYSITNTLGYILNRHDDRTAVFFDGQMVLWAFCANKYSTTSIKHLKVPDTPQQPDPRVRPGWAGLVRVIHTEDRGSYFHWSHGLCQGHCHSSASSCSRSNTDQAPILFLSRRFQGTPTHWHLIYRRCVNLISQLESASQEA